MDEHWRLKALLQEIELLLDGDLQPGSPGDLRLQALLQELSRLGPALAGPPAEERLQALGRRIEALTRRRQAQAHARDLNPEGTGMAPMIGLRFGRTQT